MVQAEHGRVVSRVRSLDELVGAHPDALRRIYAAGSVVDPASLGEGQGRVLAFVAAPSAFLVVRGVVRSLATDRSPWKGKIFDPSGTSGSNLLVGRRAVSFRVERADSALDGGPTLILRYDDPADGHAWPIRAIRDELREIAPGISIGPVFLDARLIAWWGLERR